MFKSAIRLVVYSILAYTFISCNSGEAKQPPITKKDTLNNKPDTVGADAAAAVEIDPNFQNYPVDFSKEGADSAYSARILTTGICHEEEANSEDAHRKWCGLFMNKDGYYLDSTVITTKRVEDPLGDEEGKMTAWDVRPHNSDTSLLLISGVEGLSKRKIVPIDIRKKEIFPGESTSFTYNGITYTLYATGNKRKESADRDYYIATNYRLFIKATINGIERNQMLVAAREFNDAMIEVQFVGDIDGDNIPDLILNTSYHYNAIVPTLYLSKPAGSKDVLKLMGWHVYLGC